MQKCNSISMLTAAYAHSTFFLFKSIPVLIINMPLTDLTGSGFPNFSANDSFPFSSWDLISSFPSPTKSSSSSLSSFFFDEGILPSSFCVSLVFNVVISNTGLFFYALRNLASINELNWFCPISFAFFYSNYSSLERTFLGRLSILNPLGSPKAPQLSSISCYWRRLTSLMSTFSETAFTRLDLNCNSFRRSFSSWCCSQSDSTYLLTKCLHE